ncbi:MAG: hypothetical protein IJV30_02060 [Oscillospiraceae bacterium]|nr:hypothetical protein [Oscillospiraceae bacterium]
MTLEELNGHLDMVTQLAFAKEALQAAQAQILGATQYDGMPHAHDPSRRPENLSIVLQSREDDVKRLEAIVERSEVGVREYIKSIEDIRTRAIFEYRFLCGMKWEDVARFIGGRNTEITVKQTCYRYLNITNDTE